MSHCPCQGLLYYLYVTRIDGFVAVHCRHTQIRPGNRNRGNRVFAFAACTDCTLIDNCTWRGVPQGNIVSVCGWRGVPQGNIVSVCRWRGVPQGNIVSVCGVLCGTILLTRNSCTCRLCCGVKPYGAREHRNWRRGSTLIKLTDGEI